MNHFQILIGFNGRELAQGVKVMVIRFTAAVRCKKMKEPNKQKQRCRLRSSCPTPRRRLCIAATTTQHMSLIMRQTMINIQGGRRVSWWWWRRWHSPLFLLVWFQFQKQGKDADKVKQRLAEIANYVDKVTIKSAACTTVCTTMRGTGGRSVRSGAADWIMNGWSVVWGSWKAAAGSQNKGAADGAVQSWMWR